VKVANALLQDLESLDIQAQPFTMNSVENPPRVVFYAERENPKLFAALARHMANGEAMWSELETLRSNLEAYVRENVIPDEHRTFDERVPFAQQVPGGVWLLVPAIWLKDTSGMMGMHLHLGDSYETLLDQLEKLLLRHEFPGHCEYCTRPSGSKPQ
jgi:hypothetical protein